MDDLDLNLIRVLDAMLKLRHVGRAAAELGMSQPGLSYALKRLRTHFGDPLFIRTSTGMQPTDTAERIAPAVEAILEQVRDTLVPTPAFTPATSTRSFTLMISDLGEIIVLPKLLRALAKVAPGVSLKAQPVAAREVVAALQSGQADLMIGYFPEPLGSDVFQQRLYSHGFTCLARKGHPRIGRQVDRDTFLSLQHAAIRSTGRSQLIVEQYFETHGLKRRIQLQTSNILSVPFVVAATDVVVTIPAAVGELFGTMARVQTFEPPIALPEITVRQYWHRRQHTNPANKWLREWVNRLFSGPDGWRLEA